MKNNLRICLAIVILTLALSLCGVAAAETINIAIGENIINLDPHNQTPMVGIASMDMVFDALVDTDHEGNYFPALATEWDYTEDGLTWTFKLREGVKFHNGEDFNADDVVCTFQRLLDNQNTLSYYASYWSQLESIEKVDDYTVKLHLKSPYAPLLMGVALTGIIPNDYYAEMGDAMFTEQKLIGTGPWKFVEWVDGQYTKFAKNENFWGDFDSKYDEVIVRHVLESSTAIASQMTGEVDAYIVSGGIPNDLLPLYAGSEDRIDLISLNVGSFQYLQFQMKEGSIFTDANLRHAIDYAIDREAIAEYIFGGGTVTNGLLIAGCVGHDPDLAPYEYNVEKAKEYLAASNYNGEAFVLSSNTATSKSEDVLLAIAENLNEIGINCSVSIVEGATLLEMRKTGEYDIFMVNATAAYGEASDFLNKRILGDVHHHNYQNEEMMDLIRQSNAEMNPEKRVEILKKVNKMIRDEAAPILMVTQLNATYAVNKGVTGLDLFSDGRYRIRWATHE